jgi:DNA-binding CsgD family transcriptional regulator
MGKKAKGLLTPKQQEVLQLFADGFNRNEVCERLGISPQTLITHLDGIYGVLITKDKPSAHRAVIEAYKLGLVTIKQEEAS